MKKKMGIVTGQWGFSLVPSSQAIPWSSDGSRISWGVNPRGCSNLLFCKIFAKHCVKCKKCHPEMQTFTGDTVLKENTNIFSGKSRISPIRRMENPWISGKNIVLGKIFTENCMKMKEIGPRGGAHPQCPPLLVDPTMILEKFWRRILLYI